ncbi:MAG: DUF2207 domain-containing protein [Candidatus Pacebacteria bacterium]|nr:DUF2207 domain-containing protein [Candidatus Paceibacterota bacterium]MBP9701064.1 DUF2207 domain-containing protein [Candidatus Paceibacterota bacterium]
MQNIKTTLKIFTISLGLFFALSSQVSAEVIKSFDAQIVVNTDASVSVTETIVYDSEGLSKHGIFRDITPRSSEGKLMSIADISVTDLSGNPHMWERQKNNKDIRLKIGDPDITFEGEKTYIIAYTATNAVAHLEEVDEIYWNVTGSAWPMVIQEASATVVLPEGAGTIRQACYQGPKGSTEGCAAATVFSSSRPLEVGEGLTIAVGFPRGFVHEPVLTPADKVRAFFTKFWPITLPLIVFVYMLQKWYRKGRDAKGSGVVIAQYEVIDNLTPLETAMIINQTIKVRDLVAEVLYLATKGYISITRTEGKSFLTTEIDYTLRLEKLPAPDLSTADTLILETLFTQSKDFPFKHSVSYANFKKAIAYGADPTTGPLIVGTEVLISQKPDFIGHIGIVHNHIRQYVVDKGYYTKDFIPKNIFTKKNFIILIVLYGIYMVLSMGNILDRVGGTIFRDAEDITIVLFVFSILVSIGVISLFKHLMPAKTAKGAQAKESLLGLKEYIEVAEKDRIDFHNAPEKNPALFERLLPYAIIFGQEKKWGKAFESIAMTPPAWYHGGGQAFTAAAFTSSLSKSFYASFHSSMGSAGGSGGGGSSGGGGGGGGGGSW